MFIHNWRFESYPQVAFVTQYGVINATIFSQISMTFETGQGVMDGLLIDGKRYRVRMANILLDHKLGWRYPAHTISLGSAIYNPSSGQQIYVTDHPANLIVELILAAAAEIALTQPEIMEQAHRIDLRIQIKRQQEAIDELAERIKEETHTMQLMKDELARLETVIQEQPKS